MGILYPEFFIDMKKLSRRTKICSVIFIFLIITALLVSRPIYRKLENTVNKFTKQIIENVYENTGIILSYESFSPSILASFRINNIIAKDENGKEIATVNKVMIDYRLFSLLRGDFSSFIRGVKIDGVTVDVNRTIAIVQKNIERYSGEEQKSDSDFDINTVLSFIPSNISVTNITVLYDDEYVNVKYNIKDVKLTNSRRKKNIEFNIKSRAEAYLKQLEMTFTGSANFSGTLYDDLDNSSILVSLSDFTNGDYKAAKINLVATYNNSVIEAHTIQNVFPLSVKAEYNLTTGDAYADVLAEGFEPLDLVTTKNEEIIQYVDNLKFYLDAHAELRGFDNKLDYYSSGNILVPETLVPGGLLASYSLYGNNDFVRLSRFDVSGDLGKVNGRLSYTYGTLQIEGLIGVEELRLSNGKKVTTELYIDPITDGFTFFSPQVQIGNKALTAMQSHVHLLSDSIDFDFEISDYSKVSNEAEGSIGVIKIGGSYLTDSNYAQANVSLNSISLGSVMEFVGELVPKEDAEQIQGFAEFADPYIFTGDVYVSSDFKSLSYNIPYVLVANTKEGNQYLFASASGNEQSFLLNRFDLILGSFAVNLTGTLDVLPESNDLFFVLDAVASSIPYHFTGSVIDNVINVSGDYGLDSQVRIGKKSIDGHFNVSNLPFAIADLSLIFSTNTSFEYDFETGPEIVVKSLDIEKTDATSTVNPKLSLSGSGTKYGAQLTSISYADKYSSLTGGGDITININDGIFTSAGLSISMKNMFSEEKILIDLSASNPDLKPLNGDTFMNSVYINSQVQISHFGLSRFTSVKNDNNELSASINFTGTLEHPSVFLTVSKLSMLLNKDLINISGNAILEDRLVSVSDFDFRHTDFEVTGLTGSMDLDNFDGTFSALFATLNGEMDVEIPLKLKVFDAYYTEPKTFIPDLFSVSLSSDKISGSLMKKEVAFDITLTYNQDFISIFSSDNLGLVGTYIPQTGEVIGSLDSPDLVYFDFSGLAKTSAVDINFSNININLKNFMSYMNVEEYFAVERANINGEFQMKGTFDTPEFYGSVYINAPRFYLPTIFKNVIYTDRMQVDAFENEFTLEKKIYSLKNEQKFVLDGKITLDKWIVDTLLFSMETIRGVSTPLAFKSPYVNVKGDVNCNIDVGYESDTFNVKGKVSVENVDVVLNMNDITEASSKVSDDDEEIYFTSDLDVTLGTHVNLSFDPILRCIFVPNTHVNVKIDTASDFYEIGGELKLKSGDVNYLSRNFYIKEGSIKFNQEDITNPLIKIRAETREKDSNGQNIKIILSVDNQYLKDLSPKFSAEPAKSENEILNILGQVAIADSESFREIIATAGEYYIQSTLIRDMENKLRDLMNFDIFSLRTNVIQNAIKMSVSDQIDMSKITIGNFLDNTTVYIGKYLGSSLYVDAMLHLSLEGGNDISFSNGLLFKPEFGLELELPIVNIRWNMAPDINAIMRQQYVPSTSVSLSWKLTF